MRNISPFVRNLLILALIAAAIVVLNQEVALSVVGALVRVAFFLAIAVVAYFFWRDFGRREIAIWPRRAAVGLLRGDRAAARRPGRLVLRTPPTGRDRLALILVGGGSVYAGVRTWREQRRVLLDG